MKEKEKSLLEIAIELLNGKQKQQKITNIVREVMELKGLKGQALKEAVPQFILDFMQCGYFVYCGDDYWDLKDRQPTSILDKDGHDYEKALETDEVIENENWNYVASNDSEESEESDEDNDEKQEEDEFDLTREFELRAEEELDNLFADQQEEE